MSQVMEEEIKRWTARRKSALVLEIIQGKTTVAEASRQFDLTPSEIEGWIEERMGDVEGEIQGGSIDVFNADEVLAWKKRMSKVLGD